MLAEDFWVPAMTIAERAAAHAPVAIDHERARRRLDAWRQLSALRGDAFDQKLGPLGVTAERLGQLLGEPADHLAARLDPPAWVATFRAALAGHAGDRYPGFLGVAGFLIRHAQHRLRAALPAGELAEILCASLPLQQLIVAVTPTVTLELNVARVQGRLTGDTAQQHDSFLALLGEREFQATFWAEYPVLARYLTHALDRWVDARIAFAQRLAQDLPDIGRILLRRDPGPLRGVSFGAGDSHRGGQSVATVEFEHGSVMYKPRALSGDAVFAELLDRFNRDSELDLRTPRVITRDGYGWAEFIAPAPCYSATEARAFYWRFGATVAIIYALNGTDLHYQNLIASAGHPVPIDLEALFSPGVEAGSIARDEDPAETALRQSVRATGLLPGKFVFDENGRSRATDIGGMGGADGQLSLVRVPVLQDAGTPWMRLVERRVALPAEANLPRWADGAIVNPEPYQSDVLRGFHFCYQWLAANRDELLAEGGIIARLAGVPMRMIPRATASYGKLILQSFHPDFLRDSLDRERSVARLCTGWDTTPWRDTLIRAEMDSALAGDVPFFQFRPDSTDLQLDGPLTLPGFFDQPPARTVAQRLAGLGPLDLSRQELIISGCFVGVAEEADTAPPVPTLRRSSPVVSPERFLDEAIKVGDRVAQLAITARGRVGWLVPQFIAEDSWDLVPAGLDAYDGLSGIGLFLAYLAMETGLARFEELSGAVTAEVLHRLPRTGPPATPHRELGAFGSTSGPLYYLAHASALDRRPEYLVAARECLLPRIPALLDQDVSLDVLGGAAGVILALLAWHAVDGGPEPLSQARHAARRLLDKRTWQSELIRSSQPLTGFAHGASGIAIALARLDAVTPDDRYRQAIRDALDYEESTYDSEHANWPDFRADAPSRYRPAWCHGSTGVGFARLDLLGTPFLADRRDRLAGDLATALRPDRLTGRGNHSLCHGDLGNLDLLRSAELAGLPVPDGQFDRLAAQVLGERRWRCGVPGNTETPGLLTGLSGIGMSLLRFANPTTVPSVLGYGPGGVTSSEPQQIPQPRAA